MNKILYPIAFISLFTVSCANDNAAKEDTEAPVIEWLSPVSNTTYNSGDTIKIKALISDNDELHEGELKLLNKNSGVELLKKELHIHELKQYTVDEIYVVKNDDDAELKLQISASDHHEHTTTKELNLTHQQ